MKKLSIVVFFMLLFLSMKATHISYEDLTYKCLGGLSYEFTLTLYRDCGGAAAPASINIDICSPTTGASALPAYLTPVAGTGTSVFPVCSYPSSICIGGSDIGFVKHVYKGTYTFTSAKADWTLMHNYCCREPFITTISFPLSTGTGILCMIDNLNYPGNSSPTFNDEPVLFACCNQSFSYNQSATDIDGDSLFYSLYFPLDNSTSCSGRDSINYLTGFTYLQPITSSPLMSMNPSTGYLTMYPTNCSEVSVMGVKVEEYRLGNLIGYIERDNMIVITNEATTTIAELKSENNVSVAPNPFTNSISISGLKSTVIADFYDVLGNKIYTLPVSSGTQEIKLIDFSKGIYFLKLQTKQGVFVKKIVKE